ncbi:MAG: hypothetical protein FJ224_06155 [Lentisphaerae bacterium]|nr:hypothetical protein [Lentisphaerota bacterium]
MVDPASSPAVLPENRRRGKSIRHGDAVNIPGFDIVEKLGDGTTGTVWRAYQLSLNRAVVLKTLRSDTTGRPDQLERIVALARTASSIKHPDLVQLLDMGKHEGTYYFVSEYVAGETMAETVDASGPLEPFKALRIARHVSEALENAWRTYNMPHRGIKPENVMLDEDGTVKVVDLGLSLFAHPELLSEQIRSGELKAAPHFMSPEQARCDPDQDFRSDIYSLGALMYFMLTGRRPFEDCDPIVVLHKHVDGRLENPQDLNPSVGPGLAAFIARAMAKHPSGRPSDWASFIHMVRRLEAGGVIVHKTDPYADSTVLPPSRTPLANPARQPAATTSRRTAPRVPRTEAPAWLRRSAWLLLAAWLVFLAFALLEPAGLLMPARFRPPAPEYGASSFSAATAPAPHPAAPDTSAAVTTQLPASPARAQGPAPELANLCADVADALCRADFEQAMNMALEESRLPLGPRAAAELGEVREIIATVSRMGELIREGARANFNKTIPLRIRGVPHAVTLRAMAGDRLNATSLERRGLLVATNDISFNLAEVHPADLGTLLGPANTPALCTAKFLLLLKAGDHEAALTYAQNCGPLSQALEQQAESGRRFGE